MSQRRNKKRYYDGKNNLFGSKRNNCRKTTTGRKNQYVQLKDEDGNYTGRTRLIRHNH